MQGINQKNNIASTLSDKKSNPLVGQLVGLKLKNGNKIIIRERYIEKPKFHIIYNHGNGVDLSIIEPKLQNIASILNCSVISYDYPGYGRSEGSPSEISVYSAITCIYNHLITHGVPKDKIIILGRSTGGGPATFIAEKEKIALWVENSGHNDLEWVANKQYWVTLKKF